MESAIRDKSWSKEAGEAICREWVDKEPYRFDRESKKPVYSIDTPPPYVNSPVHIGQAATYALMDMFARYKRMDGFNILFPLGLDKNGLPIEMAAEKRFGIRLQDVPREKFMQMCRQVLEESGNASISSFQQLGIGFNSWKFGNGIGEVYETDSPDYRALTQDTFIDLWNRGLVYEAERINNYCPGCQTTLADAEVDYDDLPSHFSEIAFRVEETGEKIVIGTTRPELVCTCAMVIFHPDDSRYGHLAGKHAVTPLFSRAVPIRPHPSASVEKGTGLVMMCSMGDTADIRFFREMSLEPVIAIGADGRMNGHAGFLSGMKVAEARKSMIEKLKAGGLLVKQSQVNHRTPICERSKEPIEFISMREFYVRQVDFRQDMKKLAMEMEFYDDGSRQILLDWIDAVSIDWPISRRRYYATEVPLWYCDSCRETIVPAKGKYHQPWREPSPVKRCRCGSTQFTGETRVFDTWFDSSNSPLYILQYSHSPDFFRKHAPATLRPQGKEIIRTWLYYTLLKCYHLTGKLIFSEAWINYHVVDDSGHKMSKSKGNVIDPQEILRKFGAEPFRLWCAVEGNLVTTDFRCSFDRIEGAGRTVVKLWNVARFIAMFKSHGRKPKLSPLDEWVLAELNSLVESANSQYGKYDFHNPAIRIKHFIWETFASHYLELVKNRAYNQDSRFSREEQDSAAWTLHECLDTLLKLMAPIIPMVTYRLYMDLRHKDIHFESFPKPHKQRAQPFTAAELAELNGGIWKAKKDRGLSLKSGVSKAVLPEKFRPIGGDLLMTHGIKSVKWSTELSVEI